MKPKILYTLIAAGVALLFSLIAYGTGDAGKRDSGFSSFSIDGKSFLPGGSLSDEFAALRRELSRLGVQAPEGLAVSDTIGGPGPVFSEKLVSSGQTASVEAARVPGGLAADHVLRMSGPDGTLELIMGRTGGGNLSAAARLESDRWEPVRAAGNARLPNMLRKTRGKETSIVLLDEAESSFLLIRKLSR